jgi:serine/threonine-protein kinase RsbT
MNPLERSILDVLKRHMPEILATSVRRRAQATIGVEDGRLDAQHLPRFLVELRTGLKLFASSSDHDAICSAIEARSPSRSAAIAERVELRDEQDIARARSVARRLAGQLGAGVFATQRVATATSELARNVVAYAPPGVIELIPGPGSPPTITIVAVDHGRGIEDLDRILAGQYRSRTGLGKGLLGVKKLASRFDVATSSHGTRVEAVISLV